ncbi:MAG: hypothetical protein COT15_02920 [Candidatus Diapherotrites archaeon CG08_land_8_20_14_0_20_34_12]|nr:MAG: hypothetical protein COT15_02920 [Candidatus Diapherotrites archaeon CG08_land_8_20_14_0_20_34_12]
MSDNEFFDFRKIISLQVLKNSFGLFELLFYAMLGFFTPIILGHNQILTGAIVNTMLVLSAMYIKNYRIIPLALMPSLGVLAAGLMFGNLTIFLIYLIPFIWIGNFLIIYGMKYFYLNKHANYWKSSVISSIMKSAFIGLATFALVLANIVPAALLMPMSGLQLVTALIGCSIAFAVHKAR